MEVGQPSALQHPAPKNHTLDQTQDTEIPFELLLTQEQFRQLQKLLPVGYSFATSTKGVRQATKKVLQKDLTLDERAPQPAERDKPKRRAPEESEPGPRAPSDFFKKCKAILDLLRRHPKAGPFIHPVDPVALRIPDYFDIIKEPMDLSTTARKLAGGEFAAQAEFEADVRRVWSNALTYNVAGSQICLMAQELSGYFERLLLEDNPQAETAGQLRQQVAKLSKRLSGYESGEPARAKSADFRLGDKPLSYAEKRQLSAMIRQLPTECLWDVWRIVAPENQGSNSGELEFDIDTLPPEVVRELQKFVNQKCSQLSSKKNSSKRGANPGGFNGSANFGGLSAEGGKGRTEATEKSGAFAYSPADALLQSSPTRGQPGDDGERDRDPESSFISSLDDSDY